MIEKSSARQGTKGGISNIYARAIAVLSRHMVGEKKTRGDASVFEKQVHMGS